MWCDVCACMCEVIDAENTLLGINQQNTQLAHTTGASISFHIDSLCDILYGCDRISLAVNQRFSQPQEVCV